MFRADPHGRPRDGPAHPRAARLTGPPDTPRRLKVCFFNRSYWPDTGATGQLLTELAEDLAATHGMEVTVVCGPLSGGDPEARPRRETRNGVRILRMRGTTFAPRRFAGRAANYLSYFAAALLTARRLPPQDVSVALTDPPIIGLAALAARRRAFVFVCQDIFPEVAALLKDFRSELADSLLDRIGRHLLRRADRVIALGDTMAMRLTQEKGAAAGKIRVIHNWADTRAIEPDAKVNAFSRQHALDERTVVLHAGNLGHAQNLDMILDAAGHLAGRTDIVWLFIGDGVRRRELASIVANRRLTNVRFLPFQDRSQLRWTYATADICLVSLRAGLAGYIVPSKLYPILAAGRPTVAAVDAMSETALLLTEHRCGVVIAPDDSRSLGEAVRALADDPARRHELGRNARAASALFDRERQVSAYARVFHEAVGGGCADA